MNSALPVYSPAVALFDFLPVGISALGFGALARAVALRQPALARSSWSAAALVVFGGLCKASWKLVVATEQRNPAWLSDLLFIAMAPGLVVMSFALRQALSAWRRNIAAEAAEFSATALAAWLALPVVGSGALWLAYPDSRAWFFCLLAVTLFANAALILNAAFVCIAIGLRWTAACLLCNLAAVIALASLSRLHSGDTTAWIQEAVNLIAQSTLALGAWRLSARMRLPYSR